MTYTLLVTIETDNSSTALPAFKGLSAEDVADRAALLLGLNIKTGDTVTFKIIAE